MKNYSLSMARLMAIALLTLASALGVASTAQAAKPSSIEISFDLAPVSSPPTDSPTLPVQPPNPVTEATSKSPASTEATHTVTPLSIPNQAHQIPSGRSDKSRSVSKLPPPPPIPQTVSRSQPRPAAPVQVAPTAAIAPKPSETAKPSVSQTTLSFDLDSSRVARSQPIAPRLTSAVPTQPPGPTVIQSQTPLSIQTIQQQPDLDALFQGGPNSMVARAVGSAEGTRTPDGGKTWAYRGHVDPGNGVWNMGTFSYQHGAQTPDEADRKQLQRLKQQAHVLRQSAIQRGLHLTIEEELNGIDLANQSPRAALSRGGYMDRLKEAQDLGLKGSDAVLWARTRSYLDPDTNQWNAPGLGNTTEGVTRDQQRRMNAIARALNTAPTTTTPPTLVPRSQAMLPAPDAKPEPKVQQAEAADHPPDMEAIADQIISLDLSLVSDP